MDGYKWFTLGCVIGLGAFIPAVALGDSAKEMLGFYDNYNTKTEGYNDNERDNDGTSLIYDLSYHTVTLVAYFFLTTSMWLGSVIFGFYYMFLEISLNEEYCDVTKYTKADYPGWDAIKHRFTDYQNCVDAIPEMIKALDKDGDNFVSQCEDAQFIYVEGLSKEDALRYNTNYGVKDARMLCKKNFPASYYPKL